MARDLEANWEERAGAARALWGLGPITWQSGVSTAHVGFCEGPNGPAVLKVSIEPKMVGFEAAALNHFGTAVCPRILGLSLEVEAILLERFEVVEDLSEMYPDALKEVAIWMPMFDVVKSRAEIPPGFATLAGFSEVFNRAFDLTSDVVIRRLMRHADDRKQILMGVPGENRLLHGDMHHFNVLRDAATGWRLIDPHGVVGHPLYELGAFLRNPWGPCYTEPGVRTRLAERIDVLSDRLSIPRSVVAEYGFYGAAISVAWSVEDGSDDVEGMVVMAEACLGQME